MSILFPGECGQKKIKIAAALFVLGPLSHTLHSPQKIGQDKTNLTEKKNIFKMKLQSISVKYWSACFLSLYVCALKTFEDGLILLLCE